MGKDNAKYVRLEYKGDKSPYTYELVTCNDNSLWLLARFLSCEVRPGMLYDALHEWLSGKWPGTGVSGNAYGAYAEHNNICIYASYMEEDDSQIIFCINKDEMFNIINSWICLAYIQWSHAGTGEEIPMPKEIDIQKIHGKVTITADNLIHEDERFLLCLQSLKNDNILKG